MKKRHIRIILKDTKLTKDEENLLKKIEEFFANHQRINSVWKSYRYDEAFRCIAKASLLEKILKERIVFSTTPRERSLKLNRGVKTYSLNRELNSDVVLTSNEFNRFLADHDIKDVFVYDTYNSLDEYFMKEIIDNWRLEFDEEDVVYSEHNVDTWNGLLEKIDLKETFGAYKVYCLFSNIVVALDTEEFELDTLSDDNIYSVLNILTDEELRINMNKAALVLEESKSQKVQEEKQAKLDFAHFLFDDPNWLKQNTDTKKIEYLRCKAIEFNNQYIYDYLYMRPFGDGYSMHKYGKYLAISNIDELQKMI